MILQTCGRSVQNDHFGGPLDRFGDRSSKYLKSLCGRWFGGFVWLGCPIGSRALRVGWGGVSLSIFTGVFYSWGVGLSIFTGVFYRPGRMIIDIYRCIL